MASARDGPACGARALRAALPEVLEGLERDRTRRRCHFSGGGGSGADACMWEAALDPPLLSRRSMVADARLRRISSCAWSPV